MVSGKIADGVIAIALKGYEAAKAQLAGLKGQLDGMKGGLDTLTSASAKGFAVMSGSIIGLLRAADPVRFTIFTQKLEVLAMHIGRTFIPLLDQAIKWLDKLILYFSKLSDGQRDNILHWSKLALLILGVGTAVGKAVGMLSSLWSVVSAGISVVRPLINVLSKILPIGKILRLLTLGFLLFNGEAGRAAGLFGKLKEAALPVLESLWGVLKKVYEAFLGVGGLVGDIVDRLFDGLGSGLLDVFEAALPLIKAAMEGIKYILDGIKDALDAVIGVIKDAKAIYSVLKDKSVAELPGAIVQGVGRAVVNDGADLLDSLTGGLFTNTIGDARDFVKDRIIGGKADEDAMLDARERLDTGEGDFSGDKGAGGDYGGGGPGSRYNPLAAPVRVQSFGLEEAFKKAQAGASFDPAKIAENERKKLQQDGNATLKEIADNTRKAPAALESF